MDDEDLSTLRSRSTAELVELASRLSVERATSLGRQDLVFQILCQQLGRGGTTGGSGVLEILPDGFGFLRGLQVSFLPGAADIYVSPSQIRRFNLRNGDVVRGRIRAPKESERYIALIKVEEVNGSHPEASDRPPLFDHRPAVPPTRALRLGAADPVTDALDQSLPLTRGQRVLLAAPPRSGVTTLMRILARSLSDAHPDLHVTWVMLHGRPEEITELSGSGVELLSTSFDEPASRHVQVADLALERARRMAEAGGHVVLLLDSLTRLTRACDELGGASSRALPGGLDPGSLLRPKRFFASGREVDGGGSITMVASLQTGTRSKVDDAIAEAFRGTAGATWVLDVESAGVQIWPPLDRHRSFAVSPACPPVS